MDRSCVVCRSSEGSIVVHRAFDCSAVHRSDNFIIGLTNVSPLVTAPTLWNYAVCGQYPGRVEMAETVSLKCACNVTTAFRYVILQFPSNDYANFCEVQVYIRGSLISL